MSATQLPASIASHPEDALCDQEASGTVKATLTIALITFIAMVPVTMLVAPLKELIPLRYGASAFWAHSFMSINMIGAILAAPLLARFTDRLKWRKRVAAIALAIDAILLTTMAWVPSLTLILILRFFEGAAHIMALSILMAMASIRVDPNHRGRTMGIIGAAMMFGSACGTRLGGLVWSHFPDGIFHFAGLAAAVAAVGTLLFVTEPPVASRPNNRLRTIVGLLRSNPKLLIAYAYAFIDRLCVGVVISTFTLFLADAHGLDPAERSRLLVMFLLPFAVLVYPAGRLVDRIGRIWPIALGSIAFGVIFAGYGFIPLSYLPIAMLLSGFFSAAMFAPNLTLCIDLAPASQRGAAFTGFNVAGSLGFLLGPLLAGGLFTLLEAYWPTRTAYNATLFCAGVTEILCAALTLPMLLKLKRSGITR